MEPDAVAILAGENHEKQRLKRMKHEACGSGSEFWVVKSTFRWSHEARLLLSLEAKSLQARHLLTESRRVAEELQWYHNAPGHKKSSAACAHGSTQLASSRTEATQETRKRCLKPLPQLSRDACVCSFGVFLPCMGRRPLHSC